MKHKNAHQGFAAIEIILAIVVVMLIGVGGWYVWHNQQSSKTLAANAANSTFTASQAANFVQDTYNKFLEGVVATNTYNTAHPSTSNQTLEQGGLARIKNSLDPAYLALIQSQDDQSGAAFGCAQYKVQQYGAHLVTTHGSTASVAVAIYGESGVTGTITVRVNLASHKINDVICPAAHYGGH